MEQLEIKNAWLRLKLSEDINVEQISRKYMDFIDVSKTERHCVKEIIKQAKNAGFEDFDSLIKNKKTLTPGMKLYANYKEKAAVLFVVGSKSIECGFKMVGSHIDSPRIDLKPNPLYEDSNMALLKTHYYGGIKKYQWTTMPLSLYGTAYTTDSKKVEIS